MGKFNKNNKVGYLIFGCVLLFGFLPLQGVTQSSNHWTHNFNEESSLLSGAVVGGGAGAAAIFYNPATISEIEESNLSINASLFSVENLRAKNAWGEDIDLVKTRFVVVPRFISYMIKLEKAPKLSLEVAFMNNENYRLEDVGSIDELIDILPRFEGEERYNAYTNYGNKYRDDWLGVGTSYGLSEKLYVGAGMFTTVRSLHYTYQVDIEAGPPMGLSSFSETPYYTAKFKDQDYLKFTNYRLLWKLGLLYKKDRLSLGLNITTPSINVYTGGKRVMRKGSQSNINDAQGNPVPNYLIYDYAEKENMKVDYKSPLSVAVGLSYHNQRKTKIIYTTVEYFAGLDPYRMVEAEENYDMVSGSVSENIYYDDWLTFVWGAKPIVNAAIGYRWIPREKLMVLAGFRTDFNYRKNFDYSPLLETRVIKGFHLDRYHLTGGLTIKLFGQDLMAGLQYSFGYEKDQRQFINLSDPVEYNPNNFTALQGVRMDNMNVMLNSLSLYFGATINFGSRKDESEKNKK